MDMDAFYASVEQTDNPELRGKCVLVGGCSRRSVVSAASYEARRFGVTSAMPMFLALRKCPRAIVTPVRMDRYKEISRRIMEILQRFSPAVEQISIDEAYLDAAGCERLYGSPEHMAQQIKRVIKETFNLTCSVGVAPNKFLAKIASEFQKPDGLTLIRPDQVQGFIECLPIEKVPGVGQKTYDVLVKIGIRNLGEVNKFPASHIVNQLGKYGYRLIELANGVDHSPVSPHGAAKSIGSEETFSTDISDMDALKICLLKHCEDVSRQLRGKNLTARTVTLKLKHSDFTQITRSMTLKEPAQTAKSIYAAAVGLLNNCRLKKKVRLAGIAASGLAPDSVPVQIKLFEEAAVSGNQSWKKVEAVVDAITRRYGKGMIQKANLKK